MSDRNQLETGLERVFISDCEGPISKNDNAFELTSHFVPDGDEFFTLLSKYDDIMSEIVQKPNYKRGNTLKLVLPFLKAYGATDQKVRDYSSENVLLVPGADQTLDFVNTEMLSFLVSTSYEPYIRALCEVTGFPFRNTYSTEISLDRYRVGEEERKELQKIREGISEFNRIKIPDYAEFLGELPPETRKTVEKLNEIFVERFDDLESGRMLSEIEPLGGVEKAKVVQNISKKVGLNFEDVMYVGDSITDVEAFRFLKNNGGLTIAFNGNKYAIRDAELAVFAENTLITSILADSFNRFGKKNVLKLARDWNRKNVKENCQNHRLVNQLFKQYPEELPYVSVVADENLDELVERSCEFRKKVRGEAVGKLG